MNPWVITIFAAIVVVAGGWFLGQALARVFNGPPKTEQVAQAPTAQPVVTPPPSSSPAPGATATPKPRPSPRPSPTPTVKATAAPSESAPTTATPAPAATPVPTATTAPTAAPAPTATPALRHTQPIARRPEPSSTPVSQPEGAGARVVRAYIEALRRGDPATASTYLGNGVPDESFIDSTTHISSISQTRNSDGSYKVAVDMQTAKGEFYETFTVASNRILEKTSIKP